MAVFDFFKSPSKSAKKGSHEEEVLRLLVSGDREKQREAVQSFLAMDAGELDHVFGYMAQKSEDDRRRIARTLTRAPGTIPRMLPSLAAAPTATQDALAEAIGRMAPSLLDSIFPGMVHDDAGVRRGSILALGGLIRRNADALTAVCRMLEDTDPAVQKTAAHVLRREEWEPENAPEKAFFYFLLEDWPRLVKMKKSALPLLLSKVREGDPCTRREIIRTLAGIRDIRCLPVLIELLDDREITVCTAAIEALGAIGDERGVAPLLGLLEDPHPQVRMETAWSLDAMGWKPADMQQTAAYLIALAQWNRLAGLGAPAIEPLIQALRQEHSGVRAGATEALRMMGNPGIEALFRAARSADAAIAGAARDALRLIQEKNVSEKRHQSSQDDAGQFEKEYEEGMAARRRYTKAHPGVPRGRHIGKHPKAGDGKPHGQMNGTPYPEGPELERMMAESERKVCAGLREARAAPGSSAVRPSVDGDRTTRDERITGEAIAASERAVRKGLAAVRRQSVEKVPREKRSPDDGETVPARPSSPEAADLAEALHRPAVGMGGDAGAEGLPAPDPMRDLLRALQHRDEEIRAAAIESLRLKGDEAVDYLIEALKDEHHGVRQAAAEALGYIGNQKAVGPLVSTLRDPYEDVRIAAAEVLGQLKNTCSIRFLVELFDDEYRSVRVAAAAALAVFGEHALPALTDALGSPSPVVRTTAAVALGGLDDGMGIPLLITCLADPVPGVRLGAAHALGDIGIPAIAPLEKALQEGMVTEKISALDALGAIYDDRATEAIMGAMDDHDRAVRNKAATILKREELLNVWRNVWLPQGLENGAGTTGSLRPDIGRSRAAPVEGEIGVLIRALRERNCPAQVSATLRLLMMGRSAVEGLMEQLRHEDWELQIKAAELLGKIALIASLNSSTNTRVRNIVAEALKYLGNGRSFDPLVIALRDRDEEVQIAAAYSLGYIGDRQAIEPLIQALNDDDYRVRQVALHALNDSSGLPREHLVNALKYGEKEFKLGVAGALDQIGWKPDDRQEEACYLIAKGRWGELEYLGSGAVGPLLEVYADTASDLRFEAVRAIARIGGDEAEHALARVLEDENPVLRKEAERALRHREGRD